jgi:hypothetical protein
MTLRVWTVNSGSSEETRRGKNTVRIKRRKM